MHRRRWFVGLFLGLLTVAALADVNAWPMTGWRLFSTLRGPIQPGWEVVVVDGAGVESPLPFDRLPRGYRGALHVLQEFPSLDPGGRASVCEAWAAGARRIGLDVAAVRVHRTRSTVSLGGHPPTTIVERERAYSC